MHVIVDNKDQAIYLGSHEARVSFKELEVLIYLGPNSNFEDIEVDKLFSRILVCLKLYVICL